MLGKLQQILDYAKLVEHSKLDTHIKESLIFNKDMAERADAILDSLGFPHTESLNNEASLKDFCKKLEAVVKSLERQGLADILDKRPKL